MFGFHSFSFSFCLRRRASFLACFFCLYICCFSWANSSWLLVHIDLVCCKRSLWCCLVESREKQEMTFTLCLQTECSGHIAFLYDDSAVYIAFDMTLVWVYMSEYLIRPLNLVKINKYTFLSNLEQIYYYYGRSHFKYPQINFNLKVHIDIINKRSINAKNLYF